jgi:cytochrome c oxidase cbb3-type subunit 3
MAEQCKPGPVARGGALAAALTLIAGLVISTTDSPHGQQGGDAAGSPANKLLHVPVVTLQPGGVPVRPKIANPVADDPEAVQNGMNYFNQMNCVGCHAPNGAGGMGPALSNAKFIYGAEPENIYLSILQGRPNGMPAWGGMLPDEVIWDLVAYIKSISQDPAAGWGNTTSAKGFTLEQVPAEFVKTDDPWRYTTSFSYGQAPSEQPKSSQ